ncbi:MAG TPA: hypothetical protein VJH91_02985 [Candidatus Paceibacterota bacterium]
MRRRLLFAQLGIVSLLAIAQFSAISAYAQNQIEWYFVPSHVLGGLWAMFFILMCIVIAGYRPALWTALLLVLGAGLFWEAFELAIGANSQPLDTMIDLVADLCGGWLGWQVYRRI